MGNGENTNQTNIFSSKSHNNFHPRRKTNPTNCATIFSLSSVAALMWANLNLCYQYLVIKSFKKHLVSLVKIDNFHVFKNCVLVIISVKPTQVIVTYL